MRKIVLTMADQFGPDGPQPGAVGGVISGPIYDEDEVWYRALFFKFPGGYYIVREDMIDEAEAD